MTEAGIFNTATSELKADGCSQQIYLRLNVLKGFYSSNATALSEQDNGTGTGNPF